MKKITLSFIALVTALVMPLVLASCMKEENYYTKDDVNLLIASLEEKITESRAEYNSALAELDAKYEAKVLELEAKDKTTADALAALETNYAADLAVLTKADADNKSAIDALTKSYTDKVALLEAEDKKNSDAIAKVEADYKAAVEALEAEDAKNAEAIAKVEADYKAAVEALEAEDEKNAEAIAKVEADYKAAVEALEAEDEKNAEAIAKVEADYKAAVEALEAEDEKNAEAIAKVEADYKAAVEALEAEDEKNAEAIAKVEADYKAAVEALEAEDKKNSDAIAKVEADYKAAVEALEAEDKKNSDAIAKVEAEYKAAVEALKEEYDEKIAGASELISALQEADTENVRRIAALEAQVTILLGRHEHSFGAWEIYDESESRYCENRIFCRTCTECSVLELKRGSYADHDFETVTTPPTCTAGGYDTSTCTICGKSEISNETNPVPHKPTSKLKCSMCDEPVTHYRDGDYIYFGEYPQTLKEDNVTITSSKDSRGYFLGSDGYYYAKVVADQGWGYKFSTGATITKATTYYFKVEPIRWRILSEDGESAFILCDSIIEIHAYDLGGGNVYKDSGVRSWLNGTFYRTTFTELQRDMILTTTLTTKWDNRADSAAYYTEDKIFLLSHSEAMDSAYGFIPNSARGKTMQTSDYLRAKGVNMSTDSSYYGNGDWLLRSPASAPFVRCVGYDGSIGAYGSVTVSGGIVPALQIML